MSKLKEYSNSMKIYSHISNMKKYLYILNNGVSMGIIFVHIN